MTRTVLLLVLVGLVASAGCDVTETGNPPLRAQMALTAHASEPAATAMVASAWASFGDLRLVQGEVCDAPGETEIDIPSPGAVDLVTVRPPMEFGAERADYCRVRVPLARARAGIPPDAPAELADHSLVIRGTTPGGTPYLIVSSIEREADVRSRGAPFPLDRARRALVLSFDETQWFAGIDPDSGMPGGDGTIRITEAENRALLDAFEANVESALELYRDTDEDGTLDPEDLAELLAQGGA